MSFRNRTFCTYSTYSTCCGTAKLSRHHWSEWSFSYSWWDFCHPHQFAAPLPFSPLFSPFPLPIARFLFPSFSCLFQSIPTASQSIDFLPTSAGAFRYFTVIRTVQYMLRPLAALALALFWTPSLAPFTPDFSDALKWIVLCCSVDVLGTVPGYGLAGETPAARRGTVYLISCHQLDSSPFQWSVYCVRYRTESSRHRQPASGTSPLHLGGICSSSATISTDSARGAGLAVAKRNVLLRVPSAFGSGWRHLTIECKT
ncbi:hypothetical protein V8C26DRAFT_411127 [Trichoderma gracile]